MQILIQSILLIFLIAFLFGCQRVSEVPNKNANETIIETNNQNIANLDASQNLVNDVEMQQKHHTKMNKAKVLRVFANINNIAKTTAGKEENLSQNDYEKIEKEIFKEIKSISDSLMNLVLLAEMCQGFINHTTAGEQAVYETTFLECVKILTKYKNISWVKFKLDVLRDQIKWAAHLSEEFDATVEGIQEH